MPSDLEALRALADKLGEREPLSVETLSDLVMGYVQEPGELEFLIAEVVQHRLRVPLRQTTEAPPELHEPCNHCHSTGMANGHYCDLCGGTGTVASHLQRPEEAPSALANQLEACDHVVGISVAEETYGETTDVALPIGLRGRVLATLRQPSEDVAKLRPEADAVRLMMDLIATNAFEPSDKAAAFNALADIVRLMNPHRIPARGSSEGRG